MQTNLLHDDASDARAFAVVFDTGDDPTEGLLAFAREHEISAARLSAIGAFRRATLGFFSTETNEYEEIPVEEQTEVLSMTGNLALHDGQPKLHAHVVLGRRSGEALGGHLLGATVRPTLEVMLTALPTALHRQRDAATGLPLLSL